MGTKARKKIKAQTAWFSFILSVYTNLIRILIKVAKPLLPKPKQILFMGSEEPYHKMPAHKLLSSFILKDIEIISITDKPDIRVLKVNSAKISRLSCAFGDRFGSDSSSRVGHLSSTGILALEGFRVLFSLQISWCHRLP